jgi:hypothetical protein
VDSSITFGSGGNQEGRGGWITNYTSFEGGWGAGNGGGLFFVEGLREELDHENEFYVDQESSELLYIPRSGVGSPADLTIVAPVLDRVVSFIDGAGHISFQGLEFHDSSPTFYGSYEAPGSGPDWSLHRGGMVFIEDAKNISLYGCNFHQPNGNGVFLSGSTSGADVQGCDFSAVGDSAVALLGSSDLMDASGDTLPHHNVFAHNHIHEVGVYGKQVAAFTQALAHHQTWSRNVVHGSPRALINQCDVWCSFLNKQSALGGGGGVLIWFPRLVC